VHLTRLLPAIIATLLIYAIPTPAAAQVSVGVGVGFGFGASGLVVAGPPPAIPYYAQPPAPYPDYQWTPGYWGWGPAGYYWVPGVWVAPPAAGLYWTPGYWGYANPGYAYFQGYWGPSVGFYGGINYGFGYFGTGFVGGTWFGGAFSYNTAVTNVNRTTIRNTYSNRTVINRSTITRSRVSFNGGHGGVSVRPTAGQIAAARHRIPPTAQQREHSIVAARDRSLAASVNHGRPPVTTVRDSLSMTNKPAHFAPVTSADRRVAQREVRHTSGKVSAVAHHQSTVAHHQSTHQHGTIQGHTQTAMHREQYYGTVQGRSQTAMHSQPSHFQGVVHGQPSHQQAAMRGPSGESRGGGRPPRQ
jgi:prolyl-tRNA editing enzyme YbaK/EbsC (Cys-tRNA(Pro) deacylase)